MPQLSTQLGVKKRTRKRSMCEFEKLRIHSKIKEFIKTFLPPQTHAMRCGQMPAHRKQILWLYAIFTLRYFNGARTHLRKPFNERSII